MTAVNVERFESVTAARFHYRDKLDDLAEGIIDAYRSIGPNIAFEVELRYHQAEAYVDAGYSGTVPAMVQSWADTYSLTAAAAADDILAQRDNWRESLENVADTRIKGNKAMSDATTVREIADLYDQYETTMLTFASS